MQLCTSDYIQLEYADLSIKTSAFFLQTKVTPACELNPLFYSHRKVFVCVEILVSDYCEVSSVIIGGVTGGLTARVEQNTFSEIANPTIGALKTTGYVTGKLPRKREQVSALGHRLRSGVLLLPSWKQRKI